jgi:hypothetical protein
MTLCFAAGTLGPAANEVLLSWLGRLATCVRSEWHMPFVLATRSVAINVDEAHSRGVDGLISKPYPPAELLALLGQLARIERPGRHDAFRYGPGVRSVARRLSSQRFKRAARPLKQKTPARRHLQRPTQHTAVALSARAARTEFWLNPRRAGQYSIGSRTVMRIAQPQIGPCTCRAEGR